MLGFILLLTNNDALESLTRRKNVGVEKSRGRKNRGRNMKIDLWILCPWFFKATCTIC